MDAVMQIRNSNIKTPTDGEMVPSHHAVNARRTAPTTIDASKARTGEARSRAAQCGHENADRIRCTPMRSPHAGHRTQRTVSIQGSSIHINRQASAQARSPPVHFIRFRKSLLVFGPLVRKCGSASGR